MNPDKNLSMVYDIPDTWQIIGLAPTCYNNQSVRDHRTTNNQPVRPEIHEKVLHLIGHVLGLVDEHMRFDRFRKWIHGPCHMVCPIDILTGWA